MVFAGIIRSKNSRNVKAFAVYMSKQNIVIFDMNRGIPNTCKTNPTIIFYTI